MYSRSYKALAFAGELLLAALWSVRAPAFADPALQIFDVTLSAKVATEPLNGRLFVFVQPVDGRSQSSDHLTEPRLGPNWFAAEPFFGLDVRDFAPGQSRLIDDHADGFPDKLSHLPMGRYRVQAVFDINPDAQQPGRGAGNLYSAVMVIELDSAKPSSVPLLLDHMVEAEPWPESRWVKLISFRSQWLSAFHHREVLEQCAVVLPPSYYDQPQRRYPTIYMIPGFGSTHHDALQYASQPPLPEDGEEEFIRVFLTGECKWGHHVFVDSATNGPRGQALIWELIPEIDRSFRTIANRNGRFLYGHSSGGWSALWLMINYPDVFGGVWSTSPDPVDFRDWQGVNLYADPPENMYIDQKGNRRPIARTGDQPVLWYDSFTHMDDALKRGGQLRSFEAVFSPLGSNGEPRKLWERASGQIDPDVARAWQSYDIRMQIESHWKKLQPLLAGRVHVTVGDHDTYYLDGAVHKLAEALAQLGSDAEVKFVAGRGHSDLLTPEFYHAVRQQMSELFRREAATSER
ncbi:MAG TPA: alpha/beta hydrolase-fold protein [Pirellulales bacterium]